MKKILLLSMPFGALERQALGISLLKAQLNNEGFECDIKYFTFTFARLIGVENYCWITTTLPHTAFAGEWIFTNSLYDSSYDNQTQYFKSVLQGIWHLDNLSLCRLLQIRKLTGQFLSYCMKAIEWKDYALVGFTSTFEQNIASLALARLIKERYPGIKIAFGGANWEGEMGIELHRKFTFVDYGFMGEADESFPALIRYLSSGKPQNKDFERIPGMIYRHRGKTIIGKPSKPVPDLDKLPIPDYSDYFNDLEASSVGSDIVPSLLFESARGCWWGAVHHCMFCGLNGSNLSFRSKSAPRVIEEIEYLSDHWKADMLQAVDNVVNMSFFKDLFPALAARSSALSFFFEIRANLNKKQVETMSKAGVKLVQPGIESLNDHLLCLMRKGTTALQNIQLLKWCKEFDIRAAWNLLFGFPGEEDEDYRKTIDLIPKIAFLGPPTACGPVRLDRFSPYFNEHRSFGLTNVRPLRPYRFLYPFDDASLAKLANYFDYDFTPATKISVLHEKLYSVVDHWQKNPEPGTLTCIDRPDRILAIVDTRSNAVKHTTVLKGIDKAIYLLCDSCQTIVSIEQYLKETYPDICFERGQIECFLNTLTDCGYMISDGKAYLSLALFNPVTSTQKKYGHLTNAISHAQNQ